MRHLKTVLKTVIGWCLLRTGLHRRLLRGQALIVIFHRVGEAYPGDAIGIETDRSVRFCRMLSRFFVPVPLSVLVEDVLEGRDLTGRVAITFDDGYLDNHLVAADILRDMRLPGCFFIATGFIGTQRIPGWDLDHGVRSNWMTWEQVTDLWAQGFEIGAHTVNHVNLGDAETLRANVRETLGSFDISVEGGEGLMNDRGS